MLITKQKTRSIGEVGICSVEVFGDCEKMVYFSDMHKSKDFFNSFQITACVKAVLLARVESVKVFREGNFLSDS